MRKQMDAKIKNSELTQFAKELVIAHNSAIKYIVIRCCDEND